MFDNCYRLRVGNLPPGGRHLGIFHVDYFTHFGVLASDTTCDNSTIGAIVGTIVTLTKQLNLCK